MKKIIALMILTIVIVTGVTSSTWAFFTDIETSANNQLVAGTLDLTVDGLNPWTATKIDAANMKPGDSGYATMTVMNAGSLPGSLTVNLTDLIDSPGTTPEPEPLPDNGELSANLDIVLWIDTDHDGVKDAGETQLYSGKLNTEAGPYSIGTLAGGATTYISLSYSIASGVGNVIQGDSCSFKIEFILSQS